jgi:hypothetical protein
MNTTTLTTALDVLHSLYAAESGLVLADSFARGLIPDIILVAHYIPSTHSLGADPSLTQKAREILEIWRKKVSDSTLKIVQDMHIQSVRDLLLDTNVSLR